MKVPADERYRTTKRELSSTETDFIIRIYKELDDRGYPLSYLAIAQRWNAEFPKNKKGAEQLKKMCEKFIREGAMNKIDRTVNITKLGKAYTATLAYQSRKVAD